MPAPAPFPRHIAIAVLAGVACCFGGNHVAARVAFDHGTGLLFAIVCRAGVTLLVLAALVAWQRQPLRLARGRAGWQVLLGLLIAVQSICLYSAVARIPVALALLMQNTFPVMLALISWACGGPRPSRRAVVVTSVILIGLLLALDLPTRLAEADGAGAGAGIAWGAGVAFGLAGALAFACGIWITEHRLHELPGPLRSFYTMAVVLLAMAVAGGASVLPGGLTPPHDAPGWTGVAVLMLLYATGFTMLFICVPRLDMARNAPTMNVEPVAALFIGWAVLDQWLAPMQLLGAAVVVTGVVLLSRGEGDATPGTKTE